MTTNLCDLIAFVTVIYKYIFSTTKMQALHLDILLCDTHLDFDTIFPRLIPLKYYYFHSQNPSVLYLINATVRY